MSQPPNGISIGSAVLFLHSSPVCPTYRHTDRQTDRNTDRPRYLPHL